eukprot:TRINITY_DN19081_c0_g1_i1.p1 TRINITY_DN19081_c0_g1~~TRINITY_DN19081_c0_g1_i1.p1  ORF type:complete len:174 (+),score=22.79 TRINITY_DN19081_c0_g1_i1:31-552(+)
MGRRRKTQNSVREQLRRENAAALQSLSHEAIQEFREVFHLFDKDGSDTIDTGELATAMRSLGMTPTDEEVEAMINEVDVDGSGAIDFQEFLALMSRSASDAVLEQQILDAFQTFDQDGDGFITHPELKDTVRQLTGKELADAEVDEIIFESAFDEDGDGRISYEEFLAFMCSV